MANSLTFTSAWFEDEAICALLLSRPEMRVMGPATDMVALAFTGVPPKYFPSAQMYILGQMTGPTKEVAKIKAKDDVMIYEASFETLLVTMTIGSPTAHICKVD